MSLRSLPTPEVRSSKHPFSQNNEAPTVINFNEHKCNYSKIKCSLYDQFGLLSIVDQYMVSKKAFCIPKYSNSTGKTYVDLSDNF